jgi:hypothetical protein
MKNKFHLLILIIALTNSACHKKPVDKILSEQSDSTIVIIGNVKFHIQPITKLDFESNYKSCKVQKEIELLQNSSVVCRHSDSLIFQLSNNRQFVLKNDSVEASWAMYSYAGELKSIGYWYVNVTYYEWYNTILINQNNGDTTIAIGTPVVSPDKKYIMCGNVDLVADFTFNGFELYHLNNDRLEKIGLTELKDWGPAIIYWKDMNNIYIKQTRVNNEMQEYTTYCKMCLDSGL